MQESRVEVEAQLKSTEADLKSAQKRIEMLHNALKSHKDYGSSGEDDDTPELTPETMTSAPTQAATRSESTKEDPVACCQKTIWMKMKKKLKIISRLENTLPILGRGPRICLLYLVTRITAAAPRTRKRRKLVGCVLVTKMTEKKMSSFQTIANETRTISKSLKRKRKNWTSSYQSINYKELVQELCR